MQTAHAHFARTPADTVHRAVSDAPLLALARLEGAQRALAFPAGPAAAAAVLLTLTRTRPAHVVVQADVAASIRCLIADLLLPAGVEVTVLPEPTSRQIVDALRPHTRAVYLESPSHSCLRLADLPGIAWTTHLSGVPLIVDSTLAGPAIQRPISMGATVVLHTDGYLLTGTRPGHFGFAAGPRDLMAAVAATGALVGGCAPPGALAALHRGLSLLPARLARQSASALAIAAFLDAHPLVSRVRYPHLRTDAQYGLARAQMRMGGAAVCFERLGPRQRAALQHALSGPSGVDAGPPRTFVRETGIDGALHLSVGMEAPDALIQILDSALLCAGSGPAARRVGYDASVQTWQEGL